MTLGIIEIHAMWQGGGDQTETSTHVHVCVRVITKLFVLIRVCRCRLIIAIQSAAVGVRTQPRGGKITFSLLLFAAAAISDDYGR